MASIHDHLIKAADAFDQIVEGMDLPTTGWVINRDLQYEEWGEKYPDTPNHVGYGQIDAMGTVEESEAIFPRQITVVTDASPYDVRNPVPFRIYDDDDELYYEGAISEEWLNGPETLAFAPLQWAMADAGATRMDVFESQGWHQL